MTVASFLKPTWMTVPDWDYTLGGEVADLCAEVGFAPDGPQRLILDATFAMKDDRPAAFEVVIIGPRQNIKTGALKQIDLGFTFLMQLPLVVWSAHEVSTSSQSFRDLVELIETHSFLERQVKRIYRPEGRERIELRKGNGRPNGGEVRFKARTRSGGRGLTGDKTVLDEGFALKSSHLGALLPVMMTRRHGQVIYASSAGMADSDVLRALRERGRRGDRRLAYFEWGDTRPNQGCVIGDCDHATTNEGCVLDDRERWWQILPALGTRVTEDAIADLRRSMPSEEFAREVLGWWDEPSSGEDLSADEWMAIESDAAPSGELSLAVDVGPNQVWSSIVACGNGVLEVVERRRGASWLTERMVELAARHPVAEFGLDPAGPVGALLPEFEREGLPIHLLDGKDAVRACGALVAGITDKTLSHRGEPELLAAIGGASRRAVGDGWKWSRKDSTVDISPLVAATYAHWLWLSREGAPISPEIYFV